MDEKRADDSESLLDDGFRRHRSGDLVGARRRYREVLARAPDHAGALRFLGVLRHQEGESAEALELLDRAVRLQPAQPPLLRDRGVVLLAVGRVAEAAESFRSALALPWDE